MNKAQAPHLKPQIGGFRARIDEMCKQCIYDPQAGGTWRKQVEDCPCFDCPLYDKRPRSKACDK
jgi:hypothetical protein